MSSQQFHAVTDAQFRKATFETRTEREQAIYRAALILDELDRLNVWSNLKAPTTSKLLVMQMCVMGRIEHWSGGLVVRYSAKEIATASCLAPRSAYARLRALDKTPIINRIETGRGNRDDNYEVPMPESVRIEETDGEQRAPTVPQPALPARASLYSATPCAANSLPDTELARAQARAALYSDSGKSAETAFLPDGPDAAQRARAHSAASASPMYVHDDESSFMGEDAAEREEVIQVILSCGVHDGEARRQAATTSLLEATAIKLAQAKVGHLDRPGGWARIRLADKSKIPKWAKEEAARKLGKSEPKPTPSTESILRLTQERALEQLVTNWITANQDQLPPIRELAAQQVPARRDVILSTPTPASNAYIRHVVREMLRTEAATVGGAQ